MTDLVPVAPAALEQRLHKPGIASELVASWLGRYAAHQTRVGYAGALTRAARLLGVEDPVNVAWHELAPDDLSRVRRGLAELYRPSTARVTWAAIAGILRHAWRRQLLSEADLARLLDEPRPSGSRVDAGRALEPAELRAISALVATEGAKAARAGAIFALGYGCGLREDEISRVRDENFRTEAGACFVQIVGKGNKERRVPVPGDALPLLERWRAERGPFPGALICALDRNGRPRKASVSPKAIWHVLDELCRKAGIAHASPHDLRRTFATELFDENVHPTTVQRLMGHSDSRTTQRYDKRPERGKREAVERLKGFGKPPGAPEDS